MRISIAAYSFHDLIWTGRMNVFGYLETVKYRYRLNTADLWSGLVGTTEEVAIRKIRQAADERDLTVVNYHVDGAYPWNADPAVRKKDHQTLLTHLRAAEILGAKTVRIDFGGDNHAMSEEQFDVVVAWFAEHARRAGEHGYRIGPENHFGPSLEPDNMKRVYEAVDHPAFGLLWHIGQWIPGREDVGDRMSADKAFHVHIDSRAAAGNLDMKLGLSKAAGYKGYYGIEHETGKNEHAEVEWEIASVKRVISDREIPGSERPADD